MKLPNVLEFTKWEQAGRKLAGIANSSAWCLGDWLVYGQSQYVDRYRRAVETAGLDYQTLRNYAWVARRFQMERRRESLSFQHHAEVAALPPTDQDRLLDLAQELAWSRNQLRECLRAERLTRGHPTDAEPETALLPRLSVEISRITRWREAAQAAGYNLNEWIVVTLEHNAALLLADGQDAMPV